jgi:hypothetical protein
VKHSETGELFAMKVMNKNVLRKKRIGTRNLLQVGTVPSPCILVRRLCNVIEIMIFHVNNLRTLPPNP